jgi:hypothetical protein
MKMLSTSLLVRLTAIVGVVGFVMLIALPGLRQAQAADAPAPRATVGAYYFDGWAGRHRLADTEAWAKDAPTHLTKRMLDEFPDREPIWGWRDDRLETVEQQIDLAADHGIAFFAFCWYWHPTQEQIDEDPKHTGLNLFLRARNSARMKFCLLVANHEGFLIGSTENWGKTAEGWMPYFKDKRPWEGPSGLNQKPGWYFPDRTPAAFGLFLKSAIDWMDDPDGRYLKALKSVVLR